MNRVCSTCRGAWEPEHRCAADIVVSGDGTPFCSVYVLNFLTDAAKQWRAQNLPADAITFGPDGIVVEHRYVRDIVEGAINDGLEVR